MELRAGAAVTGMAPPALTHEQLRAWCWLRRIRPTQLELDLLLQLGELHLAELNSRSKP